LESERYNPVQRYEYGCANLKTHWQSLAVEKIAEMDELKSSDTGDKDLAGRGTEAGM